MRVGESSGLPSGPGIRFASRRIARTERNDRPRRPFPVGRCERRRIVSCSSEAGCASRLRELSRRDPQRLLSRLRDRRNLVGSTVTHAISSPTVTPRHWRLPSKSWPTRAGGSPKAAGRWLAINTPEPHKDIIRVPGIFADYGPSGSGAGPRRWSGMGPMRGRRPRGCWG